MGQKGKITQSNEEIAELLKKAVGNVSAVAKSLGVTRQSLFARINKSKMLRDTIEEAKETIVDIAEGKLYKAVGAGMEWAIKRVLDSKRGVERGWRPPAEVRVEGRHEVQFGRIDEDLGREILKRLRPKPTDPADE